MNKNTDLHIVRRALQSGIRVLDNNIAVREQHPGIHGKQDDDQVIIPPDPPPPDPEDLPDPKPPIEAPSDTEGLSVHGYPLWGPLVTGWSIGAGKTGGDDKGRRNLARLGAKFTHVMLGIPPRWSKGGFNGVDAINYLKSFAVPGRKIWFGNHIDCNANDYRPGVLSNPGSTWYPLAMLVGRNGWGAGFGGRVEVESWSRVGRNLTIKTRTPVPGYMETGAGIQKYHAGEDAASVFSSCISQSISASGQTLKMVLPAGDLEMVPKSGTGGWIQAQGDNGKKARMDGVTGILNTRYAPTQRYGRLNDSYDSPMGLVDTGWRWAQVFAQEMKVQCWRYGQGRDVDLFLAGMEQAFVDQFKVKSRYSYDAKFNGKPISNDSPEGRELWQQGLHDVVKALQAAMPGLIVGGNLAPDHPSTNAEGPPPIPGYAGIPLFADLLMASMSEFHFGGYRSQYIIDDSGGKDIVAITNTILPQLIPGYEHVYQHIITLDNEDLHLDEHRAVRCGVAACAMAPGGYICPDLYEFHNTHPWYDIFDNCGQSPAELNGCGFWGPNIQIGVEHPDGWMFSTRAGNPRIDDGVDGVVHVYNPKLPNGVAKKQTMDLMNDIVKPQWGSGAKLFRMDNSNRPNDERRPADPFDNGKQVFGFKDFPSHDGAQLIVRA